MTSISPISAGMLEFCRSCANAMGTVSVELVGDSSRCFLKIDSHSISATDPHAFLCELTGDVNLQ